jgi:FdrA protein
MNRKTSKQDPKTVIKGIVKKGQYYDSVSLMIISHRVKQSQGVLDAAVVMGTGENKALLKASGFLIDLFHDTDDTDLLIAVKAETSQGADEALASLEAGLEQIKKRSDSPGTVSPRSLEGAVAALPGANLALISLPGKYAAAEAGKALENGLHVMIFSDHVPLEQELELKKYAREKHLLVMGPDCGTAIINGVPLAFANEVKPGHIGVVAASGTGLQEVTTLISNGGGGISQAIGTGGRDIKKEIGGITFLSAIAALAADENTHALLLVAKPPHPDVLEKIGSAVQKVKKPVAAVFLGADPEQVKAYGIIPAPHLEAGARAILELAGLEVRFPGGMDMEKTAAQLLKKLTKQQKYLRALFSGGTFCSETQVLLGDVPGIFSNAPTARSSPLGDPWKSEQHTVVDLGEDEFTLGKPHPMIDFSTRSQRLLREADDRETAVILLDLVLGYGAHMNPLAELIPVIKAVQERARAGGREIPIIGSVTGTDQDPQNRSLVVEALKKAGVIVCRSNAEASGLCKQIICPGGHGTGT